MTLRVADYIRTDHREFERIFAALQDPQQRPLLAPVLVNLLAAHARAEEAHIYPALRSETGSGEAVAHSQEEHAEADELAAKLAALRLDDPQFDEILGKLVKAVAHHLEEEEETVLPQLDQLSEQRQSELSRAFLELRAEILSSTVDLTKAELVQQAANEGIRGAESMSKAQLEREVRS
ncbi:MAG: hemerythrin domain-containing protein [Actinomycetes bacterium]